jgi:methylated-DNA-[protein]-cysteine S-methyltransferase
MTQAQYLLNTKIGILYLVANENGIESILFDKRSLPVFTQLDPANKIHQRLHKAAIQLQEYFAGKRKKFDLKLNFVGTPFQQKVWKELSKIPFGKTLSYKEIASNIQNPKAVRAVGTANGRNPFCIVIPCHRVIAANGTLGGYVGGLEVKRKLLSLESV